MLKDEGFNLIFNKKRFLVFCFFIFEGWKEAASIEESCFWVSCCLWLSKKNLDDLLSYFKLKLCTISGANEKWDKKESTSKSTSKNIGNHVKASRLLFWYSGCANQEVSS